MDLLSIAMAEVGLQQARFQTIERPAPWKHPYPSGLGGIHLVEKGRATVQVANTRTPLEQGDMVVVPRGVAHALASKAGAGRGEPTVILCGCFSYAAPEHPLLAALPPVIVVPYARSQTLSLWADYVRALAQEVRAGRRGGETIVARLSEILLIEAIRQCSEGGNECPRTGWLRGLRDEAVERALRAFHAAPEKPWTVESLADAAGQSRSAFSAHFGQVMGEAPMSYVRRWRMYRARLLLRTTDASLDELAARTGYGSAAALSLAFVREQGITPGAYRSQHGASTQAR